MVTLQKFRKAGRTILFLGAILFLNACKIYETCGIYYCNKKMGAISLAQACSAGVDLYQMLPRFPGVATYRCTSLFPIGKANEACTTGIELAKLNGQGQIIDWNDPKTFDAMKQLCE